MRYAIAMCAVLAALGWPPPCRAELRSAAFEYKQGDTVLEGYLAYDDSVRGRRPGVVVVHEWNGVGPYVKMRAEQLARLGYVALDAIRGLELADPTRIAAIGYCFGGTTVLELARSGADIAGVVSFHGGLDTPNPQDARNIRCKILALQGADDPFVPAEQVAAFEQEMRQAGVDWQLIIYGGAMHSFTNPASGSDRSRGAAYNEKADRRSWQAMRLFLDEALGR